MSRPVISLTTDFGQADNYVGVMKGVILGICPEAALVDISHEIRPQAIYQAAFVLSTTTPYFPPGAVHLIVVDPDVGSERRSIAVQTERATFVAPDNGVLGLVLATEPARLAVHLTAEAYRLPQVSATFHGRDVFAPAAAHLAAGVNLQEMGETIPLSSLVALPQLQPERQANGMWIGQVIHVDHFGNLITNLRCTMRNAQYIVEVAGKKIVGLSRTFADVQPGGLVAYVGSSGYLEIAVRNGSAAAWLPADVNTLVQIERVS